MIPVISSPSPNTYLGLLQDWYGQWCVVCCLIALTVTHAHSNLSGFYDRVTTRKLQSGVASK